MERVRREHESCRERPVAPAAAPAAAVLGLQRSAGNAATARWLAAHRAPAGALPHLGALRAAFGRHDPGEIPARRDAQATRALAAKAYVARGEVVFGEELDLWSAAHETAHVFQQRTGRTHAGMARRSDPVEREADALADDVVAGRSAERVVDGWGAQRDAGDAAGVLRLPEDELEPGTWYLIHRKGERLCGRMVEPIAGGGRFEIRGRPGRLEVLADDVVMTWGAYQTDEPTVKKGKRASSPQGRPAPGARNAAPPPVKPVVEGEPPQPSISPELIAAYRADVGATQAWLQEHEGTAIADHLNVTAYVAEHIEGKNIVRYGTPYGSGNTKGVLLHVNGNHYIVLNEVGPDEQHDYVDRDARCYVTHGETVADGDCLVDGLSMIATGATRRTSPTRIKQLRAVAAAALDERDIGHALIALIQDYVDGGSLAGVGKAVLAFIKADAKAVAAHDAAVERNAQQAQASTKPEKQKPEKQQSDTGVLEPGTPVTVEIEGSKLGGVVKDYDEAKGYQLLAARGDPLVALLWPGKGAQWFPTSKVTRAAGTTGADREYQRSGRGDPSLLELLEFSQHMSPLTEFQLNHPLPMAWTGVAGGIHSAGAFKSFADAFGVQAEVPQTKPTKSGKTRDRKSSVSASNSYSAFMTSMGGDAFGTLEHLMHPARKDAKALDLLSGDPLKDQAPKALTDFRADFIRMQTKLPTKRKSAFSKLSLDPKAHHGGPSIASSRKKLHTEAQWVHSREYQAALDRAVNIVHRLMEQVAYDEQGELMDIPDAPMEENPAFHQLLAILPEYEFHLVINRSCCTGKSDYGGGCAQEHTDLVAAFWDYAATQLGGDAAGLLRMLKLLRFRVSFPARDTNASDKTVNGLAEAGVDLGVLPKFDFGAKGAQPIDRNQFDALKLIDKDRRGTKRKRDDASPAVDDAHAKHADALKGSFHGLLGKLGKHTAASQADAVAKLVADTLRTILMETQTQLAGSEHKRRRGPGPDQASDDDAMAVAHDNDSEAIGPQDLDGEAIDRLCTTIAEQTRELFPVQAVTTGEQLMLLSVMGRALKLLEHFCDDVYNLYS